LQKETPTVAIEAMRIIAIGVDEQVSAPEQSVSEVSSALPVEPPDREELLADDTLTSVSPSEVPTSLDADVLSLSEVQPPFEAEAKVRPTTADGGVSGTEIPEIEAGPESERTELEEVVEPEPVLSKRPPPPRRRSLPAGAASEPQIEVSEALASEPNLAIAEVVAEAAEVTEAVESGETVETVEPVETVAAQPVAPSQIREGAMPAPPSRVPREPPPRPKPRGEVTVESSADATAQASPPSEGPSEKPKVKVRRPWWEELFNEDFSRALVRLTEQQIEQEVTFIEESLGVAPGAVVLDLGCGSGEHAVELASRGYGVVGYDLSLHQLALAQETAQERDQKLNFIQGDMREIAFEEVFDGIYCWNTTFGYFEEEKNVAVVERMFQALKPGGTLLIDVINRDFAAMDQPSSVWFEGDSCVCMDDMSIDFLTSRMRVKRSLILDDGRTRECTYSVRLYSLHELGKILHGAGFRVTEASGHPTTPGVFLGQSSPRIIILAQKP
jgi:SAM-dependent methyltransferase